MKNRVIPSAARNRSAWTAILRSLRSLRMTLNYVILSRAAARDRCPGGQGTASPRERGEESIERHAGGGEVWLRPRRVEGGGARRIRPDDGVENQARRTRAHDGAH